jgi:hypothetical protein
MPAIDDFQSYISNLQSPLSRAEAVTPDDANDLTHLTRAIYLGTGGTVKLSLEDGTAVTFTDMAAGWHPLRVARVWDTGTSAADIVGCW